MAVMIRASVALVLLVGSFLCGVSLTRGAVYRVGGDKGWGVGVNYTKWASDKNFVVGDTLVFKYDPSKKARLVIEKVSELEYDECFLKEAYAYYTSGNDYVQLTTAGDHYFMTLNTTHCHDGAKLHVFAHNATSPTTPEKPGPTPSPSPAPASSGPSPTPASTRSGPSPAPASAGSGPSLAPTSTRLGPSPSPAPDSSPADDAAPAKSGSVIPRCSGVVGLALGLAIAIVMF